MQFELLPPVPAVVLVRQLHRAPLFSFASVDELFRFSAIARQVRHTEGSTFQKSGTPVEYIQVLVEGKATVSAAAQPEEEVAPPRLFGFREALEGIPLAETARATETSICLAMGAEDFRSLIADNIELAEGVFRMLLEAPGESTPPSLRKGVVEADALEASLDPDREMRLIDKALLLQALPTFSRLRAEELMGVAATVRETSLVDGAPVFDEGDDPSIWILLTGELTLEPPQGGGTMSVMAGDVLGLEDTLVGRSMGWRGRVARSGKALKLERDGLFEELALHTDLLQGVFGALFRSASHATKGNA
jgi:CRP-like cAMP-binding protein